MSENYDGRGNLWREGMFLSDYRYDLECYGRALSGISRFALRSLREKLYRSRSQGVELLCSL